jgi:hypothetical protein
MSISTYLFSYTKLVGFLSDNNEVSLEEKIALKRHRLKTFENITKTDINNINPDKDDSCQRSRFMSA